jgi:branched-chain amino acid aminotransferase
LSAYGQTIHYGFGVFEGIRAYDGVAGVNIFRAEEHYKRLARSCKLVGIPFHYTPSELVEITYELLRRNNLSDAYIRPLIYCGANMGLTASTESQLLIAAWKPAEFRTGSLLRVCTSPYQRPNPKSIHFESKITGHYVNSILARSEAKSRGFDDAIMLDQNGNVAETSSANIFFEQNGCLFTPPLGHIFPGITRGTVFSICKQLGIPVVERAFTIAELAEADTAFICGTAAEISGILSLNDQPFKKQFQITASFAVQSAYSGTVLEKYQRPIANRTLAEA